MSEQPTVNPTIETKPNEVPIVPNDWTMLGAKSGYDPKIAEALRLFIVGPSGEGKTTFEMSIPDNIVLDFDDGANAVPGGRSVRIYVKNYPHLEVVIDKLENDADMGKRHWKRVSFDTVDELIAMIKLQLEKEKGVEDITDYRSEGYGYNLILQRFWSIVLRLEQAGYSWAVIGHMKTKEEVDPATKKSVTKIRESVYPGVAKKILTKADFKLTIYCIPNTVEKKIKKKLPTGQTIEVSAGSETRLTYYVDSMTTDARDNKARGVPSMERRFELPLVGGWDEFIRRYDSAIVVERTKYQKS